MIKRRIGLLAALFISLLVSTAAAQVDARARALLEGLTPADVGEIHNVDQSIKTTAYVDGEEPMESTARIVIDFDGRRLVTISEMVGMSTKLVLKDGQVTMSMVGLPMTLPAPPEAAAQMEQMFDQNAPILIKDGDVATFDGVVSYGDLVSGEQVTYTTHDDAGEATTLHYLFQDDKLIAVHSGFEDGEFLVVYAAPVDTGALMGFDSTSYMLEGGAWKKVADTHVEAVAYNTTLDESLFE